MTVRIYSCEVTMLPSFVKDGEIYDGLHHQPQHHSINQEARSGKTDAALTAALSKHKLNKQV